MCIVLCCYVRYVEIYTEQRAFADDNNFLFLFEENCCGIIPITIKLRVNIFHREIRVNDGFGVAEVLSSKLGKKKGMEHGKPLKISKMCNCKHFWTKMIRKDKNNSPSN